MRDPPRFKNVLLDLSGTLHVGDKVVSGAISAVSLLKRCGCKVRVLCVVGCVGGVISGGTNRYLGVAEKEEKRRRESGHQSVA